MLFVSACLTFALARVEKKKEKQGTATFIRCKGRALQGYRVHELGEIKDNATMPESKA